MNTDQASFEEFAKSEGFSTVKHPIRPGVYRSAFTQGAWRAWKACHQITPKAEQP